MTESIQHELYRFLVLICSAVLELLPFLSSPGQSHDKYCNHLASVVVINNFSKLFSSEITRPIGTKLGMNVPWDILHRTDVGIFDPSKNKASVIKKWNIGVRQKLTPKQLGLAKF